MDSKSLYKIKIGAEFVVYFMAVLFISAYFDLDIPTEALLEKLKDKMLISIISGVILVFLNNWLLKKGGIKEKS